MLCGHIRGLERRREMRVNRTHIEDNAATIIFIHMAQSSLGRKECPVDMNCLPFSPVAVRELLDRTNNLNPGVRDEDVYSAESGGRGIDAGIDGTLVSYVHLDASCA